MPIIIAAPTIDTVKLFLRFPMRINNPPAIPPVRSIHKRDCRLNYIASLLESRADKVLVGIGIFRLM